MNILSLLDILEDELTKGRDLPFTNKALITRDKCLDLIRDIRLNLPEEIKQAEWIKKERQRILLDAQKEAEALIKESEVQVKLILEEHEITQKAYQYSKDIVDNAQLNAKDIKLGAIEYADELLETVENYIEKHLDLVRNNRQELSNSRR